MPPLMLRSINTVRLTPPLGTTGILGLTQSGHDDPIHRVKTVAGPASTPLPPALPPVRRPGRGPESEREIPETVSLSKRAKPTMEKSVAARDMAGKPTDLGWGLPTVTPDRVKGNTVQ